MTTSTIIVAGATGDLGGRITAALTAQGADVRALVRPSATGTALDHLSSTGATLVRVDLTDVAQVSAACQGADCVVSALSGLREVILDAQTVLLDAAVHAGVPRFIPSDYSADFTRTAPGHNRNFDLRREFMGRADRAPIGVTSILNGAFLDMLGNEMPIIQGRIRRVLHWGHADQPLDFTTRDDTTAYTAAAALDRTTPRLLRIAGGTVSPTDIARTLTATTGNTHRTLRVGSVGALSRTARLARILAPDKPDPVFPAWQGMQYMVDMFSGDARLQPLDNDRYPHLPWTSVQDQLAHDRSQGAHPH